MTQPAKLPQPNIDMQATRQGENGLRCLANSKSLRPAVEAANLFGRGGELLIRFNSDGSIKFMHPRPFMENEKEAC